MANHVATKKSIRQTETRTAVNRNRVSRIRTSIKKVEAAIAGGDHATAMAALRSAQPEIARGVTKGVMKKNTAARRVSRLNAAVKALATA